jgi:hypothetical protein
MGETVILAAAGCGQMEEAWRIARQQPVVVFGTLDEPALSRLQRYGAKDFSRIPVFFYQSG